MLTLRLSEARSGYVIEIGTDIRWMSVRLINEVTAVVSSFKAAHRRRWFQGNTPNLFFRIGDWRYRFLGLSKYIDQHNQHAHHSIYRYTWLAYYVIILCNMAGPMSSARLDQQNLPFA